MAKTEVLFLRVDPGVTERVDEVAAMYDLDRATFLRHIIYRSIYGDLYAHEPKLAADLRNITAGIDPVLIGRVIDMVCGVLHTIANEQRKEVHNASKHAERSLRRQGYP